MPVHHARRAEARPTQVLTSPLPGMLAEPLPGSLFPAEGADPETVCQVLMEELLLDGNAKQNLATFCQTWETPQVRRLMDLAIDTPAGRSIGQISSVEAFKSAGRSLPGIGMSNFGRWRCGPIASASRPRRR